jgi:hypothetical protein
LTPPCDEEEDGREADDVGVRRELPHQAKEDVHPHADLHDAQQLDEARRAHEAEAPEQLRHADTMTLCSCWLCRPYRVFRHPDLREQKQRLREMDFEDEVG